MDNTLIPHDRSGNRMRAAGAWWCQWKSAYRLSEQHFTPVWGSRSGVGFLADVRRMNVAITRAKQALWVLGSAATLGRSPVWAALLGNARERGVVIRDAHARCTVSCKSS